MKQRNRKLVGLLGLIGSSVLRSGLATALYLLFPPGLPIWVLMPYFIVAGMGWVLPAMPIVRWMSRPDE
ncbi:DUF2842 domain-containing protein [Devosia sp.]|uniref:DUF2842 domain-containing protein n=1 Tax=Devosia sp. TaxID=1871048 RepID=UPI002AFE9A79|nr:DUF2842 domain-containing protein [Devosia sp.]